MPVQFRWKSRFRAPEITRSEIMVATIWLAFYLDMIVSAMSSSSMADAARIAAQH